MSLYVNSTDKLEQMKYNTELSDLRKNICLRNLKFLLKVFQFVMQLNFGGAWHTLSAMLLYQ